MESERMLAKFEEAGSGEKRMAQQRSWEAAKRGRERRME